MAFLPLNGMDFDGQQLDFILVTGEAYVDHPSFGHAIISRLIESYGFSVGIISQPQTEEDYKVFGEPKHAFFISGGVVDSMVNNYTVAKIRRAKDVYSEGGEVGKRPDRCVTVYSNKLKKLYRNIPVVIGGLEASLRRFAHYDYWKDSVMPSILVDSRADLLIFGMGERPIKELMDYARKNISFAKIKDVRGTCYLEHFDNFSKSLKKDIETNDAIFCPSFEEVYASKISYCKAFNMQTKNNDHITGKIMLQKHGDVYLVQNQIQIPLEESEVDYAYSLPYMKTFHYSYTKGVPAIEEVKFSITSQRGCFGNCNYCALTYHQGRIIQRRSKESLLEEAREMTKESDFKGYIHDVGGPTANFRIASCEKQKKFGICTTKNCIGFKKCDNLQVSHKEYLDLLKEMRQIEGIKKVFIRSGIRFDYLMYDNNDEFFHELVKHHISGQLKVAPEHCVDSVLEAMNKPKFDVYLRFKEKFDKINQKLGLKQYIVPYLISSHPGCRLQDAIKLAEYLKSINYMPEQVQDFYPTPSTKSTCMYYTELNPDTLKPMYVPKDREDKKTQRALLQYRKKENYDIIERALFEAHREDLIGFDEKCLIKPKKPMIQSNANYANNTPQKVYKKINGQTKKK